MKEFRIYPECSSSSTGQLELTLWISDTANYYDITNSVPYLADLPNQNSNKVEVFNFVLSLKKSIQKVLYSFTHTFSLISRARLHNGSASLYFPRLP